MQVETLNEQSVGTPFPDCLASAAILVLGADAGETGERYDSEVRHPELQTRRRETRAMSSCSIANRFIISGGGTAAYTAVSNEASESCQE